MRMRNRKEASKHKAFELNSWENGAIWAENGEFEFKGTQYEILYLEFKHDVGLRDMNWASQIMKGCGHLEMRQHTKEKMLQT